MAVCHNVQVMHKAPLVEAKQIEHVVNERSILGELNHPFLVGLVGAYQDANNLYLLQVGWDNRDQVVKDP